MSGRAGDKTWEELLLELVRRYYTPGGPAGAAPKVPPDPGYPEAVTEITVTNRSCGDSVTVCRGPGGQGGCGVQGLRIVARGCAVCKASAALAESTAALLSVQEIVSLCREMIARITAAREQESVALPGALSCTLPEDILRDLELLELVKNAPGRRRCATLSWEALAEAFAERESSDCVDTSQVIRYSEI
ncbi:NifU homolog involved in Fe-S cluster formation [Alkalispirochaeta americana]|uniref:NifU homolog involved in Fe-S cluster formation n=1 Tax=Alkalispirochaeta americana TaxID=159291 RepID=A0A1N6VYE6_9SPIO|nr:iron-sulfur cluster assembly scaffold protein [Alkalispirochaeta americana]SIQ82792.1 NifU homolog involved in Fe-S cluster formation [Alkalispirochaeta americana]